MLPVVVEGVDAPGFERRPGAQLGRCSATGVRRRAACASPGRSARSSCCGSTPRRWPGGCSASTRSTSRTSRESKDNTARCCVDEERAAAGREPALVDGRRGGARRRASAQGRRPCPGAGRAARSGPERTATSPSWPTWTGPGDADGRARLRPLLASAGAAARDRPAGHVRVGAAVPALHRPVPQGRPAERGVPADHRCRGRGRRRCPAGRTRWAGCSSPRRSATCGRCARAAGPPSGCT